MLVWPYEIRVHFHTVSSEKIILLGYLKDHIGINDMLILLTVYIKYYIQVLAIFLIIKGCMKMTLLDMLSSKYEQMIKGYRFEVPIYLRSLIEITWIIIV